LEVGKLKLRRTVTLWPLVGAIYLMVAGGPYGLEELVGMTGYRAAVVIIFLAALVWALPIALMATELSTTIPEDGGYYTWVDRALGPFWGFQEAWLSLVASVFDMAIYPVLFTTYLGMIWPSLGNGWHAAAVGLAMITLSAVWNLCGAKSVAASSFLFTVVLLLPFVVLVGVVLFHRGSGAAPAPASHEHLDWLGGIIVAMWNSMSWDGASTFAGEVQRPGRTYPRAMTVSLLLVTLSYAIPVAALARTGIPTDAWTTGSWVTHARTLSGPVLALAVMIGGMIGSFGMFNSLVLSYSRVPMAMAEDGFLPRWLARRSAKTDAPWAAVIALAVCWAVCMKIGFVRLVMLDVMLTGLSFVLEFAALVGLRVREPGRERPFRVPGGLTGAILIGVPPTLLIIATAVRNRTEHAGPLSGLELGGILIAAGVLVYFLNPRRRAEDSPAQS
jgi:amino acid transporter